MRGTTLEQDCSTMSQSLHIIKLGCCDRFLVRGFSPPSQNFTTVSVKFLVSILGSFDFSVVVRREVDNVERSRGRGPSELWAKTLSYLPWTSSRFARRITWQERHGVGGTAWGVRQMFVCNAARPFLHPSSKVITPRRMRKRNCQDGNPRGHCCGCTVLSVNASTRGSAIIRNSNHLDVMQPQQVACIIGARQPHPRLCQRTVPLSWDHQPPGS